MERELLVVALALALAVWGAVKAAAYARRRGAPGWASQAVVGLLCGTVGALSVAVPYADVVPDGLEPVLAALLVGAAGCVAAVHLRRRAVSARTAARAPARPRSRRRPPGGAAGQGRPAPVALVRRR